MIPRRLSALVLIAMALLVQTGCATPPYSARLLTPDEHNRCAVQGGRVDRVVRGGEACIIPTTDYGKACSGNEQCQGSCESKPLANGKSTGMCSREKGSPACTLQWVGGEAKQTCNL